MIKKQRIINKIKKLLCHYNYYINIVKECFFSLVKLKCYDKR